MSFIIKKPLKFKNLVKNKHIFRYIERRVVNEIFHFIDSERLNFEITANKHAYQNKIYLSLGLDPFFEDGATGDTIFTILDDIISLLVLQIKGIIRGLPQKLYQEKTVLTLMVKKIKDDKLRIIIGIKA